VIADEAGGARRKDVLDSVEEHRVASYIAQLHFEERVVLQHKCVAERDAQSVRCDARMLRWRVCTGGRYLDVADALLPLKGVDHGELEELAEGLLFAALCI
jgi:hypothetical protein